MNPYLQAAAIGHPQQSSLYHYSPYHISHQPHARMSILAADRTQALGTSLATSVVSALVGLSFCVERFLRTGSFRRQNGYPYRTDNKKSVDGRLR